MKLFTLILMVSLALARESSGLDYVPEAANWISNPSFDEGTSAGPVDWFFANQHEFSAGAWTNTSARSGGAGVAVIGQSGLAFGRWMTPYRIYLEPGKNYRVSYWYRGNGSTAYFFGHPATMNTSGVFSVNLSNNFKRVLGSGSAVGWTYVETNYVAPGSMFRAQLMLAMESGNKTAQYDDIAIARPGIVVVDPVVPLVTAIGMTNRVTIYVDELRTNTLSNVTWTVTSSHLALRAVQHDVTNRLWLLDLEGIASGVADVTFRAAPTVGSAITNRIQRFARVRPAGDRGFAFAAITDAEFPWPGPNERNDRFERIAATLGALDPLFVVSVGDQMADTRGLWDEEKVLSADAVRQQFGRLPVPVFALPGVNEAGRFYEGMQTRWYHEKYLQLPAQFSVEVDGTLIAGIDTTAVGEPAREGGGAFVRPGQAAWLQNVLGSYTGRLPIVAGHVSPCDAFEDSPDREVLLGLLYTNRVRAVLSGYRHETLDQWIRNPHADGQVSAPWPTNVTTLAGTDAGTTKLADASNTVFLGTVTASSDLRGAAEYHGYRYLWIRDQQVLWQDVLPLSLSVTRSSAAPDRVTFVITNGYDKAVNGLPLRVELPFGIVQATVNGEPQVVDVSFLDDGRRLAWLPVDVNTGATVDVVFTSVNPVLTNSIFVCGFETTDLPSYQNGQQLHQAGSDPKRWNVSGGDIATISTNPTAVFTGAQGLSAVRTTSNGSRYYWTRGTNAFHPVTNGVVSVSFAIKSAGWTNSNNSFLEFWLQTADITGSDNVANKAGRGAWVTLTGLGRLQAYNVNSVAINLLTNVVVDTWNVVRLDLAVTAKTYNVFFNGQQVATNLTFFGTNALAAVQSIQFKDYNAALTTGAIYMDALTVQQLVPDPTADVDLDGMPDGWETEKFGTTTNGATGDVDEDGWTNLEEYIADTHPANGGSAWPPVSIDGGYNILIGQTSTARLYRLFWTTNLLGQPAQWWAMPETAPGTGGTISLPMNTGDNVRYYRGGVQLP
jgi:hypothetical protein